jgi:Gpi18-like mannosyltransferase
MKSRADFFADILLLMLITAFSLAFFNAHGSSDVDRFWLNWMNLLAEHGFREGFAQIWADYPPLSTWFLHLLKQYSIANEVAAIVLLKITVTSCLVLTGLVYYWMSRNAVYTALVYLAVIPSSVILVYLDIYYAPILLLACWALQQRRPILAIVLFGLCCSIKYQPLIIGPFFAIAIMRIYQDQDPANYLKPTFQTLVIPTLVVLALMLAAVGSPLWTSMYNALVHKKLSFQALNVFWVITEFKRYYFELPLRKAGIVPDWMTYSSRLAFFGFYFYLLKQYFNKKFDYTTYLLASMTGFYAYFSLVTGVHENHLFIPAVLASLLFLVSPAHRNIALFVILMANINILIFNGINGKRLPYSTVVIWDVKLMVAIINTLFFIVLTWVTFRDIRRQPSA